MVYLHERGVKGFVTVNVLVFDEELASVEKHIRHIAACGVDAVIVQAVSLSPQPTPSSDPHNIEFSMASQMSIFAATSQLVIIHLMLFCMPLHSAEGASFLHKLTITSEARYTSRSWCLIIGGNNIPILAPTSVRRKFLGE